jgi:hypothetical protein
VVTVGFVFLATAIAGAILLISDFIYDSTAAALATTVVGVALAWFWFVSPLFELKRDQSASG